MFKDKSRLLLLGALVLLFLVFSNGSFSIGIGNFPFLHGFSLLKIALIAFVIWFFVRGGCCGKSCGTVDDVEEAAAEEEEEAKGESEES